MAFTTFDFFSSIVACVVSCISTLRRLAINDSCRRLSIFMVANSDAISNIVVEFPKKNGQYLVSGLADPVLLRALISQRRMFSSLVVPHFNVLKNQVS